MHSSIDDSLVFSHYSHLEGCNPELIEVRQKLRITTAPLNLKQRLCRLSLTVSECELSNYLVWHHKNHRAFLKNDRQVYGTLDANVMFDTEDLEARQPN